MKLSLSLGLSSTRRVPSGAPSDAYFFPDGSDYYRFPDGSAYYQTPA